MRGKWTLPGDPLPSSHLVSVPIKGGSGLIGLRLRCGRGINGLPAAVSDEPPGWGKTCETCLRLSRRDG